MRGGRYILRMCQLLQLILHSLHLFLARIELGRVEIFVPLCYSYYLEMLHTNFLRNLKSLSLVCGRMRYVITSTVTSFHVSCFIFEPFIGREAIEIDSPSVLYMEIESQIRP
jgi:hypothetical protein